jgi:hypothetical protein
MVFGYGLGATGLAVLVVLHGLIEFTVRPRVEVESH